MWFRNLLVYRLTQDVAFETEALEAALAAKPARACASQELSTYGFVAPFGKGPDAPLVHHSHGFILLAARKEERILPSSVVKEAVQEKVDEIETQQMRKVYRKEKEQIKDEIVQAFLPRAFIRRQITYAAIDPKQGWILVDASSAKRAEDLLSTLREALGSLPVRPLGVKQSPMATFTDWVKAGDATHGLYLLDRAHLCDSGDEGGKLVATGQDLTSEEIQNHLAAGKLVTKLALAWQDKLSFELTDKVVVTRLRFEDLLHDQAEQDGGDDAHGQQDASFVLMMMTLAEFLPQLIEALGGEELPQGLDGNPSAQATDAVPQQRRVVREEQLDAFKGKPPADDEDDDPLYAEAVSFVRAGGATSISGLQRGLKTGYNRSARMIERMEREGILTTLRTDGTRALVA